LHGKFNILNPIYFDFTIVFIGFEVNLPFAKDKWASDFNALCFFLKTYLGSARVIGGFRPDYS
jgi:hypothetical protein